jgi:hypothetical protein
VTNVLERWIDSNERHHLLFLFFQYLAELQNRWLSQTAVKNNWQYPGGLHLKIHRMINWQDIEFVILTKQIQIIRVALQKMLSRIPLRSVIFDLRLNTLWLSRLVRLLVMGPRVRKSIKSQMEVNTDEIKFVEANSLEQPQDNWKLFLPNHQVFHEIYSCISSLI